MFTVTRGQSFAGHSLADVATTGGSGAFLVEACRQLGARLSNGDKADLVAFLSAR